LGKVFSVSCSDGEYEAIREEYGEGNISKRVREAVLADIDEAKKKRERCRLRQEWMKRKLIPALREVLKGQDVFDFIDQSWQKQASLIKRLHADHNLNVSPEVLNDALAAIAEESLNG